MNTFDYSDLTSYCLSPSAQFAVLQNHKAFVHATAEIKAQLITQLRLYNNHIEAILAAPTIMQGLLDNKYLVSRYDFEQLLARLALSGLESDALNGAMYTELIRSATLDKAKLDKALTELSTL